MGHVSCPRVPVELPVHLSPLSPLWGMAMGFRGAWLISIQHIPRPPGKHIGLNQPQPLAQQSPVEWGTEVYSQIITV